MRRFADELRDAGYAVDWREADTMRAGLAAHRADHVPDTVRAMEPLNRTGRRLLEDLDVTLVRNDQFLCHYDEFAAWADEHERADGSLLMEDFHRWQRRRLDALMDGDEPVGGRWNFDHDNREPPPADGGTWPDRQLSELDDLDREVMDQLESMDGVELFGAPPDGTWATSRRRALSRLNHFVDGAEWVVVPNVVGMGMYADGGRMSTKPYVSGGNYISRMTDLCGDCRFTVTRRVGDGACPFTTLYWDFLDRHRDVLRGNHRMARPYATLDRLADLDDVRARAVEVRTRLDEGRL